YRNHRHYLELGVRGRRRWEVRLRHAGNTYWHPPHTDRNRHSIGDPRPARSAIVRWFGVNTSSRRHAERNFLGALRHGARNCADRSRGPRVLVLLHRYYRCGRGSANAVRRVADAVGLSGSFLLVTVVVLLILPLLAVLRPAVQEYGQ